MSKEEAYVKMLRTVTSLIDGEVDAVTVMSTIACELFHTFDYFNWVGFYRLVDERTLKVGPYQGTHGCLTIDIDRGVCGRCVRENALQLVNDVSALPHHIACSSSTKAEMVLPVYDEKRDIIAVLDVDSTEADCFDAIDEKYLTEISRMV